MNLVDTLRVLQRGGPQMAFVCARPDLANRALKAEVAIPPEAGLIGLITIVDIMESILQDRIYDEEDTRDRERAIFTLQKWAATKLQSFVRRSRSRRNSSSRMGRPGRIFHMVPESTLVTASYTSNERTPLLSTQSKRPVEATADSLDVV